MATRSKQPDTERIDHDPPDDLPQLIDRERWGGDVVLERDGVMVWGTHHIRVRVQCFADETSHVELPDPPARPAAAEAIVDDWLRGNWVEATVAQLLADVWGIDIGEVQQS